MALLSQEIGQVPLLKQSLKPTELVGGYKVLDPCDGVLWKQRHKEEILGLDEALVPLDKLRERLVVFHRRSCCLFDDVVQIVEVLVVDGLRLSGKVKLMTAVITVEALFHQLSTHKGPFRLVEEQLNAFGDRF